MRSPVQSWPSAHYQLPQFSLGSFYFMNIQMLSEQFCQYSSFIRGYSASTIGRYKKVVNLFCKFASIDQIEQVTDEAVRGYFFHGRTELKWSANSFITYHKTLVVFFRWCLEKKYLNHNPMDDIELPKLNKRLPPKLTKQDAFRLLEVVYNYPYPYRFQRFRNHAVFATFIFTGIRRKELLSLRYTDVDLQNMSLFVQQGKGGKDRVIPICSTLAEILRKYVEERKRLKKNCPEFFASLNRDGCFTDSGLKHLVKQFNRVVGFRFGIHKLRHTFATLMLEGGCDIFSLSKMMGHSDIKTTTIYLAASAEHLRGQMGKHPLNS